MILTGEQIRAIETLDGNLPIIACAGSGKTQVVSARVVEILKRKQVEGIHPENIVAFTFTDKAAAELKDRIAILVRREFGDVPGLAQMYVGTIHGFCLELLQTYLFKYPKIWRSKRCPKQTTHRKEQYQVGLERCRGYFRSKQRTEPQPSPPRCFG